MFGFWRRKAANSGRRPGFLSRLARDSRGNTLAIVGAALVPLTAMIGSGVDMSRAYMARTRLQSACDAGALAGRKMMTGTSLTDANKAQAKLFFDNNFKSGWFKTSDVSFQASDTTDGQVMGTASVKVPVTLMSMFGAGPTTLNVTCEARKEIGDVDVMFVLDVTGSMTCSTSETSCSNETTPVAYSTPSGTRYYMQEKSNSKIKALRTAVLTFYDTLAAAADANARVRYGFVPYASSVNVGGILPADYIDNTSTFPTRYRVGDADGSFSSTTYSKVDESWCDSKIVTRSPSGTGYPATRATAAWTKVTSGSSQPGTCKVTTYNLIPVWRYDTASVDVSGYKTGSAVLNPTLVDGTTSVWDGCILEREVGDTDINLTPSTTAGTKWRPAWIDAVYDRPNVASDDTTSDYWPSSGSVLRSRYKPTYMLREYQEYACPKQAQRLKEMTRTDVSNYVNAGDFRAIGYTYHDVGMIWGARFISPNGAFASDTDCRPNRTCGRHIVFMTDGDMNPLNCVYSSMGYERLEGRVSGYKPVGTCVTSSNQYVLSTTPNTLEPAHNARLQAICTQAKNNGITVWVVAYAQSLTADMKACASSPDTAIYAPTDQKLQDAFKQIAGKIAELRISK